MSASNRKVVIVSPPAKPVASIEVERAVELVANAFKLKPELVREVLEGNYQRCAWVGLRIGKCEAVARSREEVFCKRHSTEAVITARDVTMGAAYEEDVPHIDSFTSENLFSELGKMLNRPLRFNRSYFIPSVGLFDVTTTPEGRTIRLLQGDATKVAAICPGLVPRSLED